MYSLLFYWKYGQNCTFDLSVIVQRQSGEVYLYKFSRTETGDPILANIESDDEYAKAAEAFDVVLDNARKAEAAGEPLE